MKNSKLNLKNLDVKQLAALQADIEKEVNRKKQAKKKAVIAEVKKLLASHGLTLDDLPRRGAAAQAPSKTKPKRKVAPKYRSKEDASLTWTGRGRKPRWVEAHLNAGGKLEDLAI